MSYLCDYNPQGLQEAYDATTAATGAETSEAIFAEGDLTQVVKDLRQEEHATAYLRCRSASITPGSRARHQRRRRVGSRHAVLHRHGPTVKQLVIYDAPTLTDSDLALSFATSRPRTLRRPVVPRSESASSSLPRRVQSADDESFAEAAAQGQTVFTSAGDTGDFVRWALPTAFPRECRMSTTRRPRPTSPVGGTSLLTNANGSYDEELAWTAGGGGISYFETAPSWRAGDGVVGTITGEAGLRTLPDISMDADPNTGANVYVGGTLETVGGTSLSSRSRSASGPHRKRPQPEPPVRLAVALRGERDNARFTTSR